MSEEKKDILDFFFDGDIIITGAQGYTNVCKILETGNYMFAINDFDSDLNVFFMHVLLKPSTCILVRLYISSMTDQVHLAEPNISWA